MNERDRVEDYAALTAMRVRRVRAYLDREVPGDGEVKATVLGILDGSRDAWPCPCDDCVTTGEGTD